MATDCIAQLTFRYQGVRSPIVARFDVPHATVWKKQRPTFDHIRPRVKGGGDEPENLQLAHAGCNKRKGDSWAANK